jgi:uncharacterized protein
MISDILQALYLGETERAQQIAITRDKDLTLFEAAALGDIALVTLFLECRTFPIDAYTDDGFTALHLAAFFGHYNCLKSLIAYKAPVNAVSQNPQRLTPLHSAVADKDEKTATALAAALINAGADVNAEQAGGYTTLRAAIENKQPYLEKLLRASGAVDA